MASLSYDIAYLLDGGVLLLGFLLLYQRRMFGVINTFALQALVLALAAAWQGYVQGESHLYVTAAIAIIIKASVIPYALRRIIIHFGIHRTIDTAIGIGESLIVGAILVALSIMSVLPITADLAALTREKLALALSAVLLGLLMMITRRNAITQVVGFMALENSLILAAVGVQGMPLVVEMGIAFEIMVAFIIFGIFFFHIRDRFESLDLQYLESHRGERR